MEPIAPTSIRYIKLGAGGCWEAAALDGGRLEWGVASDPHDLMAAGDWAAVRDHYLAAGLSGATATAYTNEARAYYEGDPNTLWITFARGRMWWGFAEPQVHWTGGDGSVHATRHRLIRGGWRDCDITGDVLLLDRLSTGLTRLGAYRRTSCGVSPDQRCLCLRYINAAPDTEQAAAMAAKAKLERTLGALIRRLSWADFEGLVDLILARGGWQRVSALGGTLKDVDLIVEQPLTGERMAVQVKSAATQAVVDDYARRLGERPAGERLMLVCHSPTGTLTATPSADGRRIELVTGDGVAQLVVATGLINWVLGRA